ncbi:hypothetical protein RBA41_24040 [Massilia sp. CCM 9210]|uniref:hypothetical protein n=1 Tax=Massilia scottii TaxID=3057166 RepID=UPI002796D1E7|nr:hypothetical protein [Massilia sp. CCM 9210]MDQ1816373.1 hypothetical protein [Massilia sp. CCM 9210]
MNKIEMARDGRQLADQLEKLAPTCHPKSDEHAGLLREAGILRAKAKDAEYHCGVIPNLKTSVLMQYCGPLFLSHLPGIVKQVRAFHAAYDERPPIKSAGDSRLSFRTT